MNRNCRIWWPKQISPCELSSSCFLFGWFVSSSDSLDVVVAFISSHVSISQLQCDLEGIICDTAGTAPTVLHNKSVFSLLGQCAPDFCSNGVVGFEEVNEAKTSCSHNVCGMDSEDILTDTRGRLTSQCHYLGGLSEQCKQVYNKNGNWVQLVFDSNKMCENSEVLWIPTLCYICWNGQKVSNCDVHKPKWVDELQQKQPNFDLTTVILAINCATAAKKQFERHLHSTRSLQFSFVYRCHSLIWSLLAVSMASFSTFFYLIFQFSHSLHSIGSQLWISSVVTKIFGTACINVQIRCCQILYWPIILQERGLRSLSNVEYAEKAALQKHSMWSSVAADVLLGNAVGVAMLCHVDSICSLVLNLARDITNHILRSGCVWLMGVPAGFKLNIELAGVLGIISLNTIQIWSTLWILLGSLFVYVIKAFAIAGILFGATLPAALTIDLVKLATSHVLTLHWFFSLLYSSQIQAIAALWRLFRGQKQNPLRQRLDSYDYVVKQHIVGSLMFTPLLLLLPTTSVFYVFFSIMNMAISFTTLLIQVIISVIHATPYVKILLWLMKRKRFPSGIWFEIVTCQINSTDSPCKTLEQSENVIMGKPTLLVSCLHSNFMGIGKLVLPHYRNVFSGFTRSTISDTWRGVLTGRRMTSTPKAGLPSPMPWMYIPYREYWRLCRDSILMCRQLPPCTR